VNEFVTLLQILFVVAATTAPIVVIVRFIAGHDTDGSTGIFPPATGLAWPQGVQEEDPQPWKVASSLA
jgi:hypothetical protein